MKFYSKNINAKIPTFWVEDYTEEEKEKLKSFDFKEFKLKTGFNSFKKYMTYSGKGCFGLWNSEEAEVIIQMICDEFNLKSLNILEYKPN